MFWGADGVPHDLEMLSPLYDEYYGEEMEEVRTSVGERGEQREAKAKSVKQLREVLAEMCKPGTYAGYQVAMTRGLGRCRNEETGEPAEDFQVFVDGVGRIRFPLEEEQAQAIISKARERTTIGTPADNIWELDTDQFLVLPERREGSSMAMFERMMRIFVGDKLGITRGSFTLRAEPHKMRLYGPGAAVEAHLE